MSDKERKNELKELYAIRKQLEKDHLARTREAEDIEERLRTINKRIDDLEYD